MYMYMSIIIASQLITNYNINTKAKGYAENLFQSGKWGWGGMDIW
jgi:hypothetical protein